MVGFQICPKKTAGPLWEDSCHLVRWQGLRKIMERADPEVRGSVGSGEGFLGQAWPGGCGDPVETSCLPVAGGAAHMD